MVSKEREKANKRTCLKSFYNYNYDYDRGKTFISPREKYLNVKLSPVSLIFVFSEPIEKVWFDTTYSSGMSSALLTTQEFISKQRNSSQKEFLKWRCGSHRVLTCLFECCRTEILMRRISFSFRISKLINYQCHSLHSSLISPWLSHLALYLTRHFCFALNVGR